MSYNETIYSGLSAHPAREVADELHTREWNTRDGYDGLSRSFGDLVGAVVTLARTVADIEARNAKHDADAAEFTRKLAPMVADMQRGRRDPDGSLPPESDAVQAARLAAHNLTTAQVDAAREARGMTGAHALSPHTVEALRAQRLGLPLPPAEQLALVYDDLRELARVVDEGKEAAERSGPHPATVAAMLRATLDTVAIRIAAMLEGQS